MERGDSLQDDHHVLRYVRPGLVDGDHISTSAFLCKQGENECSVNLMECFELPIANQCKCIRDEKRIDWRPTGKLSRLNVGAAKAKVEKEVKIVLTFFYDPEDCTSPQHPKPHTSHSIINDMPRIDSPEGEMVGALLREVIPQSDIFPTVG